MLLPEVAARLEVEKDGEKINNPAELSSPGDDAITAAKLFRVFVPRQPQVDDPQVRDNCAPAARPRSN